MLRAEQDDDARRACERVAEVVEGATHDAVAVGLMAAVRARPATRVAVADADLRLGQILGSIDAEGRVGAIFAGSWHGATPERSGRSGDTLGSG